jgi:Ca2+-binding EF-hand superfamily protein
MTTRSTLAAKAYFTNAELREISVNFAAADKNNDGGLELVEFQKLFQDKVPVSK